MFLNELKIHHGSENKPFNIFSIHVSQNNLVATGSVNGETKIWENEKNIQTLKNHSGTIMCVRFYKNLYLATGSDDNTICIYKYTKDFKIFKKLKNHTSDVNNLVWTDKHLIGSSVDGKVSVYKIGSFEIIKNLKHDSVRGISVDPSNSVLAVQTEESIIFYDNQFIEINILSSIFGGIIVEAFFSKNSWSPDGKYIAVCLAFNNKSNTVEIINKDDILRKETQIESFSLIGHVAPIEVAAFNPKIFKKNDMNFYVIATCSQDNSVAFWTSLTFKPFLLVKNISSQPILDACWSDDGLYFYVCSYDGSVKKINFKINDFGEIGEEQNEEKDFIPFSLSNIKTIEHVADEKNKEEKVVKERKRIKPILIAPIAEEESLYSSSKNSFLAIFKSKTEENIQLETKADFKQEDVFVKQFDEYKIEIKEKRRITVYRGDTIFYTLNTNKIKFVALSKKYIGLVVNKNVDEILIYHLENGILALPFMVFKNVISLDLKDDQLLILNSSSEFTVINIKKKKKIVNGNLPLEGTLVNINLDKTYFILILYSSGAMYYYNLSLNMWMRKNPNFNSIFNSTTFYEESSDDTDKGNIENNNKDETLSHLEYNFIEKKLLGDINGMLKTAKKMTKLSKKIKSFDDATAWKYKFIFSALIEVEHRREVIVMLEEMNSNCVLQPFVYDFINKINS